MVYTAIFSSSNGGGILRINGTDYDITKFDVENNFRQIPLSSRYVTPEPQSVHIEFSDRKNKYHLTSIILSLSSISGNSILRTDAQVVYTIREVKDNLFFNHKTLKERMRGLI